MSRAKNTPKVVPRARRRVDDVETAPAAIATRANRRRPGTQPSPCADAPTSGQDADPSTARGDVAEGAPRALLDAALAALVGVRGAFGATSRAARATGDGRLAGIADEARRQCQTLAEAADRAVRGESEPDDWTTRQRFAIRPRRVVDLSDLEGVVADVVGKAMTTTLEPDARFRALEGPQKTPRKGEHHPAVVTLKTFAHVWHHSACEGAAAMSALEASLVARLRSLEKGRGAPTASRDILRIDLRTNDAIGRYVETVTARVLACAALPPKQRGVDPADLAYALLAQHEAAMRRRFPDLLPVDEWRPRLEAFVRATIDDTLDRDPERAAVRLLRALGLDAKAARNAVSAARDNAEKREPKQPTESGPARSG